MSAADRWAAYTGSVVGAPVEGADEKFAQLPESEQNAWAAADAVGVSKPAPVAPAGLK